MSAIESKLIVFAKAPVPGTVKTRLQPTISSQDAAKLQTFFIQQTLTSLADLETTDVELRCFPDENHPVFQQCAQRYDVVLKQQQGDDLGERMANALQEALADYQQVVIIGTDCPEMISDHIKTAFLQLRQGMDTVIGPAQDGGYVLLGLRRFSSELFVNINWGSDKVLFETREKLRILDWKWYELQSLQDIDTPDDLRHFPSVISGAGLTLKL